ncbi:MAG TPA: energy transducer TonB [Thermoanaerobaculia bacterium]|nr:energy transducer TonB [Thermoanaerobaculia bacterium]
MTNRKSCIRCHRAIDESAKICPYCNWDQSLTPPAAEENATPAYVPPRPPLWRNRALGVFAFVALVVLAFVIGTLIHGFEPSEVKAAQMPKNETAIAANNTLVNPSPRSNVTLVPVTGPNGGLAPIEQPITTAPPQAPGQQAYDATAMPESEYTAAAARAKAEQQAEAKAQASMVDPRSLSGNAYDEVPQPAPKTAAAENEQSQTTAPLLPSVSPQETSREAFAEPESAPEPSRTPAVLESRPLPHIATDHDVAAHLTLTVGPDGHVTDIDVGDPVPDMGDVISAVQRWRFKPATENGEPVTSRVSVDITFHANE